MRRKNIRFRLTLITSIIILSFLVITTILFSLFLTYFSQIIEKVYGIDDDILTPFYSIIFIALGLLIVFALIASILGGTFVSEHFLTTVSKFTDQIKKIREGGLDQRLPLSNNDELDTLGSEFNSLMDDIEDSMEKQNQFVSDASHELKTPLAILNGNLDMLSRWGKEDPEILENALEVSKLEVSRMITLTNELLQLTRGFDERDEVAALSINPIISRIISEYQKLYPDFKIAFHTENPKDIYLRVEHFEQIILILLDNAIKHSREETKSIEILHQENRLEVKDYGVGIKEAHRDKIFDRFYRVDEARENNQNSFGLGLSILKRISEWYHFDIAIESKEGQYTVFIITFNGGKNT
ncbi:two-component system sensor histidine kinase ArlS [Breznakia sp. PF5-3]|uniref:sensor histidine kinase n=1 Tax=unclassified Breznakia TaxID=2623764 RepID=UPI00240670A3|nr:MULTISPECIES: HAMP domain-containing sensor histidine kinase [unclassified Breznakia]MDF9824007.1 two-component system sensor histidine kinase ArlS [Breznakia sp. PM6-1]MDF9834806.1 two-component system sensor histidine kinase ArlS [Breznakia sp. PF5-3]MDF9838125.1 two-component system sensor histidine kinase ArlS [Breznakia sp. PFB2-8]MDF9860111.1 two-component system sensor histidine kinase ArlS [Breznakia sp. PH5-24]